MHVAIEPGLLLWRPWIVALRAARRLAAMPLCESCRALPVKQRDHVHCPACHMKKTATPEETS